MFNSRFFNALDQINNETTGAHVMTKPARNVPLDAFWMPFTANRQFKTEPRMLVDAKGMYYTTEDGREIIDGTSGLWCCNAGHGHAEIADAVHRQLSEMDYAPSF
jgi:beta-alanine--pyruvate transaminase